MLPLLLVFVLLLRLTALRARVCPQLLVLVLGRSPPGRRRGLTIAAIASSSRRALRFACSVMSTFVSSRLGFVMVRKLRSFPVVGSQCGHVAFEYSTVPGRFEAGRFAAGRNAGVLLRR